MKVLTVRQPWASAIMSNAKRVENRKWFPGRRLLVGERFAIHAGAAIDRDAPDFLLDAEHLRDRGVVLGTVQLRGVHLAGGMFCDWVGCAENPWAMWGDGMVHWMLADPRRLVTPIPARGQLGLWTSPTVDDLLRTQPYA
jgi:hypothetical protein